VGRAQIVLDWYSQAPAATLLLDDYPNAAAAYSLRLLNSAYTGDCVIIRRASDNALDTIGFAGGVLDTAALKTFCASTDCFVRTWYDQSGIGRDAAQTTNANQPRIVSGGVVDRSGGEVAINFDGTNDFLTRVETASTLFRVNFSVFAVHTVTGGSTRKAIIESDNASDDVFNPSIEYNGVLPAPARLFTGQTGNFAVTTTANNYSANTQRVISALKNSTTIQELYINNTLDGSTSPSVNHTSLITGYNIGTYRSVNDRWYGGFMHEIVLYNSYESTNRTGIYTNMNAFYQF